MLKKLAVIVLVCALAFGAGIAIAQGLFTYTVPAQVTVIGKPQVEGISLWWDEACTQPVEFIDFGEVEVGGKSQWVEFYVRNDTLSSFRCLAQDVCPKEPPLFTAAMFTPFGDNDNDFDPDEVGWMSLRVATMESIAEGITDFEIIIDPVEI